MPKRNGHLYRSGEAARMIGLDRKTLTKYVREGKVEPSGTMLGGHYLWSLEKINEIRATMGLGPVENL